MSEPKTKKRKPSSSASGASDDDDHRSSRGVGWDSLVPDVLVHILSYASNPSVFRSASIVDRSTHDAVRRESERGLDGIRLAYLNDPNGGPNRFGRLVELPLDDPKEVSSFLSKSGVSSAQMVVLERMFERNAEANPSDPRFVVAGGSMLSFWRSKTGWEAGERRAFDSDFGDVDVFVLENGNDRRRSDEVLESVLRSAGKDIERAIEEGREPSRPGGWEYGVLRNSGTLTMVSSGDRRRLRPLQVVLRRISCVEELLSFFDLDCCRFAYDGTGNALRTTVEGLRALKLKRNFVGREHVENSMYCRRAIKYGYRGFDTRFGVLHPFAHLFGPEASAFCGVGDGDKDEDDHDEDGEHSEAITTDRADWVDEGLYTTFANCSLDDLNEIMFAEDRDDDDDELVDYDYDDYQDENGEMLLRYRGSRRTLKAELEESGFAPSFEIHFDSMRSDMFVHIYYQSHLQRKYNISRCYITGEWFKARGLAPGHDDESDDDERRRRASHFSPRGWAINQRGASADRDLTGTIAVVTGARVNIGFATTLALLRRGATVVGTTRFVADANRRYEAEKDFSTFRDRLVLYPLDLRCVEDVQSFATFVSARHSRIHLLVNNAAQTVRLPLRCYAKLIRGEYLALARALRRAKRPSVGGETRRDGNDADAAAPSIDRARIEGGDGPTSDADANADPSDGADEEEAPSDGERDGNGGDGSAESSDASSENSNGSAMSSAASSDPPSDNSPSEALSLLKSAAADVVATPEGGEEAAGAHLYALPPALTSALRTYPSLESFPDFEKCRVAALRRMFGNLHPDDRLGFPYGIVPDDPWKDGRNDDDSCSWNLKPTQVHPVELFEAQTINHLSPTMLLNGLVPCLSVRPTGTDVQTTAGGAPSYVINVTSAEGRFSVDVKESNHVHTNMSKAALNMLTRSGSSFYARRGILVNSVDTGWVSSSTKTWKEPPLTANDGAMRTLHPVLTESMESGKLYKNYEAVPW